MNCINGIIELFKNCQTSCPAITLAVVAFLLGAVVAILVAKVFCPCGKASPSSKKGDTRKPQKKEERPFEKRKPHPAPADGSVEIYVGNLSYDMTEANFPMPSVSPKTSSARNSRRSARSTRRGSS